jgi:hypothetical protein
MRRSIWDAAARGEIVARLQRLMPASERRWGKMDCTTMVGHCADSLRMVLGERDLGPPRGPLRFAPGRYLVIYLMRWPKGRAKTPVEPRARSAEEFESARQTLLDLLERAAQRPAAELAPTHYLFGRMRHRDWGVLVYRHLDHHLTQFGV